MGQNESALPVLSWAYTGHGLTRPGSYNSQAKTGRATETDKLERSLFWQLSISMGRSMATLYKAYNLMFPRLIV
ncbi:hypothetical protein PanWU01x14_354770 [Parasponia andersonii]|uniref:Uncharacterized protein n=1 Tax=Parasponia andersonii TaxID=3476 RepID=A0A2P5A9I0_PARAD|nr:hypothetical protein PanWU01x14_354770 [Parasponia andersonii]